MIKIDFPVEVSFWETSVQFWDECGRMCLVWHRMGCGVTNLANRGGIGSKSVGRLGGALVPLSNGAGAHLSILEAAVLACAAASRANPNGRSLDARERGQEPEAAAKRAGGRPHYWYASSAPKWSRQ